MLLHGPAGEQMLAKVFSCNFKSGRNSTLLAVYGLDLTILRVSQWFAPLRQPVVDRSNFFTKGWCVSPWLGKTARALLISKQIEVGWFLKLEWGLQCVYLEHWRNYADHKCIYTDSSIFL